MYQPRRDLSQMHTMSNTRFVFAVCHGGVLLLCYHEHRNCMYGKQSYFFILK